NPAQVGAVGADRPGPLVVPLKTVVAETDQTRVTGRGVDVQRAETFGLVDAGPPLCLRVVDDDRAAPRAVEEVPHGADVFGGRNWVGLEVLLGVDQDDEPAIDGDVGDHAGDFVRDVADVNGRAAGQVDLPQLSAHDAVGLHPGVVAFGEDAPHPP